ncbi:hypothetical protein KW801_02615 [Candidatus Saccharibacteria bacterium]|nr:hypothetical protein [Candidatus Saccharibacteria bacterium]
MHRAFILSLASLMLVLFPTVASASFAPADRQTFQCISNEDCPGPTFVTFNSFTDAPNPDAPNNGDERGFFEAKDAALSTSPQDGFSDTLAVRDGELVMFRVYVHNDANPNLMGVDAATAHNVSVMVQLPANNSVDNSAIAYISSTNSRPLQISDTVSFSSTSPVNLTFDQNSPVNITKRTNNGTGDFATNMAGGVAFTDNNNVKINLGDWPGGFNNHGLITFTAVVHTNTIQPVAFACSSLLRSTIDNNRSTFTANANGTVSGANITSYNFTVKDSSGRVVDNSTVNTNAQSAIYNFNQSTPGTYTVSSVVNSDKGSTSSSVCSQQITVLAPTSTLSAATTSTPVTATTNLPNTGAGDILGIFSGASILGGAGHYAVRRLRR